MSLFAALHSQRTRRTGTFAVRGRNENSYISRPFRKTAVNISAFVPDLAGVFGIHTVKFSQKTRYGRNYVKSKKRQASIRSTYRQNPPLRGRRRERGRLRKSHRAHRTFAALTRILSYCCDALWFINFLPVERWFVKTCENFFAPSS